MHKLKEKLMDELYDYEEKVKKNPNAKMSDSELQKVHMITDTVKNIDKIEMLEGDGYSQDGGSSYAMDGRVGRNDGRGGNRGGQGGNYSRDGEWMARGNYNDQHRMGGGHSYDDGDSSYARRKRDSMGRYSRDDGREDMTEKLREMMQEAEGEEREAIRRCLRDIEKA